MKRRAILLLMAMAGALVLASGAALAALNPIQCQTNVACYGTNQADRMTGTDGRNEMYGRGAGDTLKGLAELDVLYGQGGNDKLFGGSGNIDDLYGGAGNDTSNGGSGLDVYIFESNDWGRDTISDPTYDNQVVFRDLSTSLSIDLISGRVSNAAGTSTVDWAIPSMIAQVADSSTGDDTIFGNAERNYIYSHNGFDEIYAGDSNDDIDVRDGGAADYVDCGDGTDRVSFDGRTPFSLGDTVKNCEIF